MSETGPDSTQLVSEAARLVDAAKEKGKVLRIYGAAAIFHHCPGQTELFRNMGRRPGDIDLAAYQKDSSKIAELISSLGYGEDLTVSAFGGNRLVFNRNADGLHCDVFLGKLEMSHVLYFEKRLELDYPTAPLADLLLSKLQILKLNEKDAVDTVALLREHRLGEKEKETVDVGYVSELCSKDWGLWRTVTGNLRKVDVLVGNYSNVSDELKADVSGKIREIERAIESSPKNLAWKLRARVGDSRKWYNDVEDLYR